MQRAARPFGAVALVVLTAVSGPAGAAGVRKGTRGVLEVEFVLSGKGASTLGGTDHNEWRVARSLSYRLELVAGELQAKPFVLLNAPVGAQSVVGKATAVVQKHQSSLDRMQAEVAKCKGDENCEARVSMDFMASGEGSAMMGDMIQNAQSVVADHPRYQRWSGLGAAGKLIGASGRYKVDEYSKTVVYDPICGRTHNLCTTVKQTTGEGSLLFAEAFTRQLAEGGVAVDDKLGLLTLGFPTPYVFALDVDETVQSTQAGTRSRKLSLRVLDTHQKAVTDRLGEADHKITVPLREERGQTTIPLANALYGAAGTMTIRWRFALVP